jgi:hypothetical protein
MVAEMVCGVRKVGNCCLILYHPRVENFKSPSTVRLVADCNSWAAVFVLKCIAVPAELCLCTIAKMKHTAGIG